MVLKQAYAIFDLEGTLITLKPDKTDDFILLGQESIFSIFNQLHREKFIIVIYCKNAPQKLYDKVKLYFNKHLNIPLYFTRTINLPSNIDRKVSVYCGNEVSKQDPYPPYQKSNVDARIAVKYGLKFIRPIDLFGQYIIKSIQKQELLIMVGMPGSGKSTQAAHLVKSNSRYIACDTDAMPGYRRDLTLKCVRDSLEKGYSVIALALNENIKRRNDFITIGRQLGVYIRIAWFIRDGRPFNRIRHLNKTLPSTHYHRKPVPESVYIKYNKDFQEPSLKECDEIIIVY